MTTRGQAGILIPSGSPSVRPRTGIRCERLRCPDESTITIPTPRCRSIQRLVPRTIRPPGENAGLVRLTDPVPRAIRRHRFWQELIVLAPLHDVRRQNRHPHRHQGSAGAISQRLRCHRRGRGQGAKQFPLYPRQRTNCRRRAMP